MNAIFKFAYVLQRYDLDPVSYRHAGPLFYRWLPDGESDAIVLDGEGKDGVVKLWFERKGYVGEDGFVRHEYQSHLVDDSVLRRQAVLDAGAVRGEVELANVSGEALNAVRANEMDNQDCLKLAKRVIKKNLEPAVACLIDVLRVRYGQYWIRKYKPWDSSKDNIGTYCMNFHLKVRFDYDLLWRDFLPEVPHGKLDVVWDVSDERYKSILNKDDWYQIQKMVQGCYMPPELGELVLRAHELLDQGLVRYALLEAATLAELAVEEYLKERVKRDKGRLMAIQQFWELPLRAKLVIVATLAEIIEAQEIDSAVQAISLRNEIVHEGKEPPENAGGLARSLIQLSAKLVFGEEYKMPSAWIGNKLFKDDRS